MQWAEYLLATELYHCTPSELDEQSDKDIEMHIGFLAVQRDQQFIEQKRAQQRARARGNT